MGTSSYSIPVHPNDQDIPRQRPKLLAIVFSDVICQTYTFKSPDLYCFRLIPAHGFQVFFQKRRKNGIYHSERLIALTFMNQCHISINEK